MELRIISKKMLLEIVPFSAQHILRMEKQGRFPRRIRLGARRVGWRLTDIEAWINERANGNAFLARSANDKSQ